MFLCRAIQVDLYLVEEKVMGSGFWLALLAGDMDVEDQTFLVFTQGCQTLFPGFTNTSLLFCNCNSWIFNAIYLIDSLKRIQLLSKWAISFFSTGNERLHTLSVYWQTGRLIYMPNRAIMALLQRWCTVMLYSRKQSKTKVMVSNSRLLSNEASW
jgi:hypothetical protein